MGRYALGDCKPTATMLAVVVVFAVLNTLTKMAFNQGMHTTVLITLRQLTAFIFLAPIAYFRERKTRPKLTVEIFVYLFFSAVLGASLTQWLFFVGLQYTTATFACAFINMTPMFTFLVALPFGMEKLVLKTGAGIAKVIGTTVGFTGAMLLALYQGPSLIKSPSPPMESVAGASPQQGPTVGHGAHRWVIGSLALLAGSACWSFWFILQSRLGKKYPALYSGTAFVFLLSFLQMAAVGLATEKDFSVWILRSKLQIITVLFMGIMGSGTGFLAMSWCIEQRGPVFTTAFTPLIQVTAAGVNIVALHEQLHVGSVLGSALVVAGLYFVLWAKTKEASDAPPSNTELEEKSKQATQTEVV
ncbi:WAT1-related protein At3g30340-like [Phragmites australis]|uniref:WAT1-related protein At3g30340-like n=1 Tax=Phragmites australis TaxID=29695 RepID=UPI002D792875|nr:WAT1-related protein At3g30340-like [Phragmites australis]